MVFDCLFSSGSIEDGFSKYYTDMCAMSTTHKRKKLVGGSPKGAVTIDEKQNIKNKRFCFETKSKRGLNISYIFKIIQKRTN